MGMKCRAYGDTNDDLRYVPQVYCDCAVGYEGELCEGEFN